MPAAASAVDVRKLSKTYPLGGSPSSRLRQVLRSGGRNTRSGVAALRDVTFTVKRGEAFGVIGANGSGKSTLLQMIAGILRPTSGTVDANGRLSALLELGSGFSPEFSGRDNVYLNGAILGLSRQEIDDRYETIEHFAEIGDFIAQPVKTYSTGMVLRLAFAVAAHVDPDILIVDEALAVGDISFRQRCMRRIHDLRARGTTILFVSHETSDVKALCERCIWLREGAVEEVGEAEDVVQKYMLATVRREIAHDAAVHSQEPEADSTAGTPMPLEGRHRTGDGRAVITGAELVNSALQPVREVSGLDSVAVRVRFTVNAPIQSPVAGFLVRNAKGENMFGSNSARENYPIPVLTPGRAHTVEFHWAMPELPPARYTVSVGIADGDIEHSVLSDYVDDAIAFTLEGSGSNDVRGYFKLPCAAVTVH